MPFGALERPALGLSLLQAAARRARASTATSATSTFAFADHIGLDDYQWIATTLPYTASPATGSSPRRSTVRDRGRRAYVDEVLGDTWRLDDGGDRRVAARARCGRTVPRPAACGEVPWGDHDLVGFTSTFEQNLASLALARRAQARRTRDLTIVFGGANWEGEMGRGAAPRASLRRLRLLGRGRPDRSPRCVARPRRGDDPDGHPRRHRPGAADGTRGRRARRRRRSDDLDALPVPDFDDYFAARDASTGGRGGAGRCC